MEVTLEWKIVSTKSYYSADRQALADELENKLNKFSKQGWTVHEINSSNLSSTFNEYSRFGFMIILKREKKDENL